MLNYIPILGWLLDFLFRVSIAIPFYFLWNHLAPKYFYWLPPVYQEIPFWDCVWLFMCLGILYHILIPKLASVEQNNGKS